MSRPNLGPRIVSTALIGAAALVAATLVAPTPAVAEEPDTPCSAGVVVALNPGVSLQPSSGTLSSGQDGSLVCNGKVNGKEVVGGGTGGADGKYGVDGPNSCSKLDGKAVFKIFATLPGKDGPIEWSDTVTGTYAPLGGNWFFGGSFKGQKSYGTYRITPAGPEHNCVVSPVSRLLIQADAFIVNGSPDAAMTDRMVLPD